jgi:hypothetical protein
MRTVRRLYFYGLALISIEVIIWGVVNLLRTIVSRGLIGSSDLLATGLSLVLVGVPIFLVHWRTAQRDAARDEEERTSYIRAIFLYAALFATLLPVIYAVLAVVNRSLVALLGGETHWSWFGADGTSLDNLIAIAINAVVFAYFWIVLRADWREHAAASNLQERSLPETRRLYRYLWVLIGLTILVSGAVSLLRFLFSLTGDSLQSNLQTLAGAISLLIVGTPLWAYHWWSLNAALIDPAERRSLLRLVVLYLISLAGVIGVLAMATALLSDLIRWISGESFTVGTFISTHSGELGGLIVLGVMWWYYGDILNKEVAALPDQPRREALHRLYNYILSAIGLALTFTGLMMLIDFLSQLLLSNRAQFSSLRGTFSDGLAVLLAGLPLWVVTWQKMQREAARKDDTGDHARRSVLRKAYLYLALFLLVIGAMAFSGQLLYTLLDALLSGPARSLAEDLSRLVLSLLVVVALLVYHWRALREDTRAAQQTLSNLHAAFPTLVLVETSETSTEGVEDEERSFADALVQALKRSAPRLPVAVHFVARGAPDESMLAAKAILLPVGLAMQPPESLHLWLNEYRGQRVLIPLARAGWHWLGQSEQRPQDLAREAAATLRQLAEGESVRQSAPSSPWTIAGYVLGAIFGVIMLMTLFSVLISSLID